MRDITIDPQLILLLTTIVGFAVQAWREHRNRQWASEDRKAATAAIIATAAAEAEATRIKNGVLADQIRLEALRVAATVREDMQTTAQRLAADAAHQAEIVRMTALATVTTAVAEAKAIRDEQALHSQTLAVAIEATKAAAHDAYKEANNVNLKIERLNERLVEQGRTGSKMQSETETKLDTVVHTTDAIDSKVSELVKRPGIGRAGGRRAGDGVALVIGRDVDIARVDLEHAPPPTERRPEHGED